MVLIQLNKTYSNLEHQTLSIVLGLDSVENSRELLTVELD